MITMKQQIHTCKGIMFQSLSTLFYALMNVFSKLIFNSTAITPFELAYYRGLFNCLVCIIIALTYNQKFLQLPKHIINLLFLRSFVGTMGFLFCMFGNKYLPISHSTVLYYTFPIFTQLIGAIFLGESITKGSMIGTITGFIGITLIALNKRGGQVAESKWYYILPIIAALFDSTVFLIVRKLSIQMHWSVAPTYFGLFSATISYGLYETQVNVIGRIEIYKMHSILLIACLCICNMFGQIFMNIALIYESAGKIASIGYLQVVISFIIDICYFKTMITIMDVIGSILVVGYNFGSALVKSCNNER